MTYLDNEVSVHGGKPIELYKFEGTYENYYYTSSVRKIKFGKDANGADIWYLPIPLQRTEIAAGTENDDGLNITIDLPVSAGLISVYGFEDSPPELNLTIYRYHDIMAPIPYWIGPVVSITTNDGIGTVQSNSELASLFASDFPNVYYQAPCNRILFDVRCKVVEANYSGATTIDAYATKTLAMHAIPIGASGIVLDGKLIGGEVVLPSGERRMIVGQAGVVLTLNFPFSRVTIGAAITVTAGCDHSYLGDCKTRFANQKNYGGFPFIGTNNPFTESIAEGSTLPDNTCLPQVYTGILYTNGINAQAPECNSLWDGNRFSSIPATQPNGAGGKVVTQVNLPSQGAVRNEVLIYEVNDPSVNPALQGQVLVSLVETSFNHWQVNYHFEPEAGLRQCGMFPSARYCGSVGLDGGFAVGFEQFYGYGPTNGPTYGVAGNNQATWDFGG